MYLIVAISDGPPYATGKPHYGHIMQSSIKDAVLRYKTMRGYYVPRRVGWDTHGLPVEIAVEKELELHSKKDIENKLLEIKDYARPQAIIAIGHAKETGEVVKEPFDNFIYFEKYGNRHAKFINDKWLEVHLDEYNATSFPVGTVNHLAKWGNEETGIDENVLRVVGWGALIAVGIKLIQKL